MAELKDGCVKPARGPLIPKPESQEGQMKSNEKEVSMLVKVGKPAIDFEASAFIPGEGFKNVKLSDYKGKWIVLCFYPGDFTFV